jgi:hypothetical protein
MTLPEDELQNNEIEIVFKTFWLTDFHFWSNLRRNSLEITSLKLQIPAIAGFLLLNQNSTKSY